MADLVHLDHLMFGSQNDPINMALRRYAGMAITNLTFGDVVNKVRRPSPADLGLTSHLMEGNISADLACPPPGHPVLQEELPSGLGGPASVGQRGASPGGLQHPEEPVLEGRHQ